MATTTTHYGFTKPGVNDYVDISVLNANYDNLDNVIYNNQVSAQAALDDLAPEYDATATYSVGDYVTYNKTLYKCTTAIATAEAFDDTKWTAVKVGGELKSHDARISDLEAGVELEASATNSFDDGIDSYFKKVVSTIVPVQAGSGTPSPTNVRAISGFTECTVTDTNGTDTNTVTISFGSAGTVYGGYVDLISGKLTVTRQIVTLNGSETYTVANQSYIKSDACDAYVNSERIYPTTLYPAILSDDLICDKLKFYKVAIWNNIGYSNGITINSNQIHINISNDLLGITDYTQETTSTARQKIKTWVTNNPLTITIPVLPTTIQLTPAQLRSLVGANRLTSSTGKVTEVEYIKNKTIAWLLDLIRA